MDEKELLTGYHGVITKEHASELLKGSKPGTFIFGGEKDAKFIYPRRLCFFVVTKPERGKENEKEKEEELKTFCVRDRYLSIVEGYSLDLGQTSIVDYLYSNVSLYSSLSELTKSIFHDLLQQPLPCKEQVNKNKKN